MVNNKYTNIQCLPTGTNRNTVPASVANNKYTGPANIVNNKHTVCASACDRLTKHAHIKQQRFDAAKSKAVNEISAMLAYWHLCGRPTT